MLTLLPPPNAADRCVVAGKQVWATGARYDGDFYNDTMHGQGLLRYENGDQYQGTLFDGQVCERELTGE